MPLSIMMLSGGVVFCCLTLVLGAAAAQAPDEGYSREQLQPLTKFRHFVFMVWSEIHVIFLSSLTDSSIGGPWCGAESFAGGALRLLPPPVFPEELLPPHWYLGFAVHSGR